LEPRAFVADLLLYDRLVVPVPTQKDLGRWVHLDWNPDRQKQLLDIAGPFVERVTWAEVDGRRVEVKVHVPEPGYRELGRRRRERAARGAGAGSGTIVSPMQGTVLDVKVAEGDTVEPGQVICVIEAMKMENEITAHKAGTVAELPIAVGSSVASGDTLAVISSAAE